MNEHPIPKLVTSRPDAEVAKELKAEVVAKLEEICIIVDRAKDAGFNISFGIGPRWDGKQTVTQLIIAKHF